MRAAYVPVPMSGNQVLTNSSSLFNMESVGNEGQVWVGESDDFRNLLLECVSWVEHKLDPSKNGGEVRQIQ